MSRESFHSIELNLTIIVSGALTNSIRFLWALIGHRIIFVTVTWFFEFQRSDCTGR
jgi:hypothetical protein